jgi:hypothetical protein
LPPGSVVGHYIIQQEIGAGSGGVVYRALDHRLQRAIAVKILDARSQEADTAWALALREARAAAGQFFIAMELVEGRTLLAAIPGHGLAHDAVLHYGAQIASALAHAHEKGFYHGDLSSKNVMVTFDDQVKVTDFGFAGLLSKTASPAEPPEGVRRDLQQLGILLCQMATGEYPPGALDVLAAKAPPSAILESGPVKALSHGLRRVIARCLETNSARSYQRAQQAAADLESETAKGAPPNFVAGPFTISRRNALISVVVLAIVALLVVVLVWAEHMRKPGPSAPPAVSVHQIPEKPRPVQEPAALINPNVEVWVNTTSDVYHCADSRLYGKTEKGKYMTQGQARTAGYRPARGKLCQ